MRHGKARVRVMSEVEIQAELLEVKQREKYDIIRKAVGFYDTATKINYTREYPAPGDAARYWIRRSREAAGLSRRQPLETTFIESITHPAMYYNPPPSQPREWYHIDITSCFPTIYLRTGIGAGFDRERGWTYEGVDGWRADEWRSCPKLWKNAVVGQLRATGIRHEIGEGGLVREKVEESPPAFRNRPLVDGIHVMTHVLVNIAIANDASSWSVDGGHFADEVDAEIAAREMEDLGFVVKRKTWYGRVCGVGMYDGFHIARPELRVSERAHYRPCDANLENARSTYGKL